MVKEPGRQARVGLRQRVAVRQRYVARGIRSRIDRVATPPRMSLGADSGHHRIALYFHDDPSKLYQLRMWLPVLEAAPKQLHPMVVLRNEATYWRVREETSLPVVLVPKLPDLVAEYERSSPEAILYVNNSWANFQSLMYQKAAHIHVNHGESDKLSMVSNQVKAYDRVFVAGQAAADRYASAIAWLDSGHLVRIGRPQLDLTTPERRPAGDTGRTMMYAPTWEGENLANNYTSVDVFGPKIIAAMLDTPDSHTFYKPHPKIASSNDRGVRAGHAAILRMMERSDHATVRLEGDILPLLGRTDLLVADVSSVGLDFLYLRPDRPQIICDRRTSAEDLETKVPLSRVALRIDPNNVSDLPRLLSETLQQDPGARERARLRDYYFDGLTPGQSAERFAAALEETMRDHRLAVESLAPGQS